MKDLSEIMQKAQEMQAKIAQAQSEAEDIEATGKAGAGLVTMTLKGNARSMSGLSIDASLLGEDKEILEDLIIAAHADANTELDAALKKQMESVAQGMGSMMPGFKMPF